MGRIDSALRYSPPNPGDYKTAVLYRLVLTDKHWELGPDGVTEREVLGPLAWRIENPEPILWVTLGTAVRYVTDIRDKSTDPAIKKNADQTLAKLKHLH